MTRTVDVARPLLGAHVVTGIVARPVLSPVGRCRVGAGDVGID